MTDMGQAAESRRGLMMLILVATLAAAALAFSPALFNDGDTGWHLATGRFILDTRSIPARDPFSFTFLGQPWTAHEWLADVMMAALFDAGGWAALSLPFAVAVAGVLLLVGRKLLRTLPLRYVFVVVTGLAVALAPGILVRPHVLAWLLLAVWLMVLLRARERQQPPPLATALLMTLWANIHASYLIGLALAGAFALEALVEERNPRRTLPGWTIFGLLALAAAFVSPHGVQGFLYPFQVSGMKILPMIDEWRPTRLPEDIGFVVFAAALTSWTAMHWRRIGWVRLALLAGFAWMAIVHSRHQPLFAIVGVLAILPQTMDRRSARPPFDRRSLALLAGGLVLVGFARLAVPLERADGATYPKTAIARIPADFRAAPVLNSYSFGGPLILNGIAPFIDGRADMYGDDFTILHSRLMKGDMSAFRAASRRWDFRWAILAPAEPLATMLDREPGWRRIYADRWAVIHVRK